MKSNTTTLIVPVLLMGIGSGWLLTTLGVMPGIDWVWTLGLALVGILTLGVGGFNKVTIVVGPFFIVASCLSVLRQTQRISVDVEVPVLVIISGFLLLVARSRAIPMPPWALPATNSTK